MKLFRKYKQISNKAFIGPFDAESILQKIEDITAISPNMSAFEPLVYTNQTHLSRIKNTGMCFVEGNIHGAFGTSLRDLNQIPNKTFFVVSNRTGQVATRYDEDTTNAKLHYGDLVIKLNFSLPVEIVEKTISFFCNVKFAANEISYIKALSNGSIDVNPLPFLGQQTPPELISFTKQMMENDLVTLKQISDKMINQIMNNDFSQDVTNRLKRRLHIVSCLVKHQREIKGTISPFAHFIETREKEETEDIESLESLNNIDE